MIASMIRAALSQRLIVIVLSLVLCGFGLRAAMNLSVDAFPDVTNVQVQVATEAPGRSPEEIERFVTVPLEIAMTGMPGLVEMRSLNKSGLSIITLVFTDTTDVYFARQLVTERLRSEEHTSELQSPCNLVCRLLLEKKKTVACDQESRSLPHCTSRNRTHGSQAHKQELNQPSPILARSSQIPTNEPPNHAEPQSTYT